MGGSAGRLGPGGCEGSGRSVGARLRARWRHRRPAADPTAPAARPETVCAARAPGCTLVQPEALAKSRPRPGVPAHPNGRARRVHLAADLAALEAGRQAARASLPVRGPRVLHRALERAGRLDPTGRLRARRPHLAQPQARLHLVRGGGSGALRPALQGDGRRGTQGDPSV